MPLYHDLHKQHACAPKRNLPHYLSQLLTGFLILIGSFPALGWGFTAHKQINRHAVFTLPPGMFSFYKYHIHFLTEHAVNPDKRRYAVEGEAPRHYIDLDHYRTLTPQEVPQKWSQAQEVYPHETLMRHGTLPWHINLVRHQLTQALAQKDVPKILRLSADIGHYIADANVPLHTTANYNGQFTDQEGIHGLWETRLPELFSHNYNFLVGTAVYVSHPQQRIWEAIQTAHQAVAHVLSHERQLSETFSALQKYSHEQKGGTLKRVYSEAYAKAYHDVLQGQVERQMRASIKMVGDFWFTCWVDAGQPDLTPLMDIPMKEARPKETLPTTKKLAVRCCGE